MGGIWLPTFYLEMGSLSLSLSLGAAFFRRRYQRGVNALAFETTRTPRMTAKTPPKEENLLSLLDAASVAV